jgi:hypothetical protein
VKHKFDLVESNVWFRKYCAEARITSRLKQLRQHEGHFTSDLISAVTARYVKCGDQTSNTQRSAIWPAGLFVNTNGSTYQNTAENSPLTARDETDVQYIDWCGPNLFHSPHKPNTTFLSCPVRIDDRRARYACANAYHTSIFQAIAMEVKNHCRAMNR